MNKENMIKINGKMFSIDKVTMKLTKVLQVKIK